MTNFTNGKRLLAEAERIAQELESLYSDHEWNLTVRRAQEVVELSLKSVLKMMAVEYPKEHDAGKVFEEVVKQKGLNVDGAILAEIVSCSKWLAEERAPAFYYDKKYTEEKASKAKHHAERILNFIRGLSKQLMEKKS